ncbi:site-specific integrase [Reticulibacter mediterranei]|uniref:Site-specific integrase n=1 Tax=Reticulibacter mediterranei TaxID=2778369 RepID=A0A8J3IHU2_9CHLR|nr:tyrosine-type recombinase/integrase [Reticulibacter mediterranei]GHO94826.1 site-specific integrase [Reticulibacter mediterranei]
MPRRKKEKGIRGFGSVYQRGSDGRYVAKYKAEDTRSGYKEEYARTEAEAYAKLEKAWLAKQQGRLATGPQQTVEQFFEYWLEDVHQGNISYSSYRQYRKLLRNYVLPTLGKTKLQNLSADQINALYTSMKKRKYAAETIRAVHRMLHKALKDAVNWSRLSFNVCDKVQPPRAEKHDIQPLDKEQAQRLLEAAKGTRLETLLILAVTTGMRQGELIGLKWQDINFEEGGLQVRRSVGRDKQGRLVENPPKTEQSRRKILLPRFVMEALLQERKRQAAMRVRFASVWQERDIVFAARAGGFRDPSEIRREFKNLLKEAGLPNIRFHDLRHSAATILLSMGIHPKLVQELLGHSSITMTMDRYSHVLPSMQREMMNKLDDLFTGE